MKGPLIGSIMALLVVTVGIAAVRHRGGSSDVATYRVHAEPFVRRVTAEGNLKSTKATPVTAPTDAPGALKVAWIAEDGAIVKKDDVVVRFDPTDFEKELVGGNEDHATAANNMTKSSVETGTTRTNLLRDAHQAETELESARRFNFDDAEAFSRYQRIENEVDQKLAGERKSHAERVLGVREGLSKTELDLISIEDKKAALKIRNAQQGLRSLEVHAPYDGILVLQRDWRGDVPRVGATLWSGSPIGEIPDMNSMQAEVFVLEADAAGLAVDKKAVVMLESNPTVAYSGRISRVDKLARPRVRNVPVQYFGVTIALDRTDPRIMKPGARVRAVIDVENRASAFAIPRQALFENKGKRIVYRLGRDGGYTAVPVDIASSTAGRVVVTKGLSEGDRLALVDPTAKKDES